MLFGSHFRHQLCLNMINWRFIFGHERLYLSRGSFSLHNTCYMYSGSHCVSVFVPNDVMILSIVSVLTGICVCVLMQYYDERICVFQYKVNCI